MPPAKRFAKQAFRNSVFGEQALQEGYLLKLSAGVVKRWQRRYFVLSGHYLKYYEDEKDKGEPTKLKGAIDVKNLQGVSLESAGKEGTDIKLRPTVGAEGGAKKGKKDPEPITLRCKDAEAAKEWADLAGAIAGLHDEFEDDTLGITDRSKQVEAVSGDSTPEEVQNVRISSGSMNTNAENWEHANTIGIQHEQVGLESRDGTGMQDSNSLEGILDFEQGDQVLVDYRGRGKWCSGNVAKVCRHTTDASSGGVAKLYEIEYDDGERELGVGSDRIRSGGAYSCSTSTTTATAATATAAAATAAATSVATKPHRTEFREGESDDTSPDPERVEPPASEKSETQKKKTSKMKKQPKQQQPTARTKSARFAKRGQLRNSVVGMPITARLREGPLEKLSGSGRVLLLQQRRWQRRYFVAGGHYLSYYESERSASAARAFEGEGGGGGEGSGGRSGGGSGAVKGAIDLRSVTSVEVRANPDGSQGRVITLAVVAAGPAAGPVAGPAAEPAPGPAAGSDGDGDGGQDGAVTMTTLRAETPW